MFLSTFGLSSTPPSRPAAEAAGEDQRALRAIDDALRPDRRCDADRPCGGCGACQLRFSF